jgi:hypothetical protein
MGRVVMPRARVEVECLEERSLLAGGSAVIGWNAVALQAIRVDQTPSPRAALDLAIVQISVARAVVKAQPHGKVTLGASIAAAADRSLDALFPRQAATFDAAFAAALGGLHGGTARNRGVRIGVTQANGELDARAKDGSNVAVPYNPGTQPGQWRPTPPTSAPALYPQWPVVTPFLLASGNMFRPPPPPAVGSPQYTAALSEVDSLGRVDSTSRTSDQTVIDQFWADGAGTSTVPGHWNEIAASLIAERNLGAARASRVFALLDAALADAGIAAWDAIYAYNYWRPITAIRTAGVNNNNPDPTWSPLSVTPPFPSYVSAHSAFSCAAATVLASFFGSTTPFSTGSDGLPFVTRSFANFDQAVQEAGRSEIYGGVHYQFDNTVGLALGRRVGLFDAQRASRLL